MNYGNFSVIINDTWPVQPWRRGISMRKVVPRPGTDDFTNIEPL